MRTPALWIAMIGLAACGGTGGGPDADAGGPDAGPPDPDDGARSGTRLKLIWTDYGGTRVGGVTAHDLVLGEDCRPERWDDGVVRCTPEAYSLAFTDAACTAPVGVSYVDVDCPLPPPAFYGVVDYTSCQTERDVLYRPGAEVSVTAYFERAGDGSCVGPYTPTDQLRFDSLGAEVARDALVELTDSTPADTRRYQQRFHESADGARLFDRVEDTVLATRCYPAPIDDDTVRCGPDAAFANFLYADAACSVPVADRSTTCEPPEILVKYPYGTACPRDLPRYFTAGADVTAVYQTSGAACVAAATEPATAYYAIGDELVIPELPYAIDAEAGRRIQLAHASVGDGASVRLDGQYDTSLGTTCFALADATGTLRCYPAAQSVQLMFRDAACTDAVELAQVYVAPTGCDPVTARQFAYRGVDACPFTIEVFEIGAVESGPLYVDRDTCEIAPDGEYHRLGPQIPDAALAAATVVVDP